MVNPAAHNDELEQHQLEEALRLSLSQQLPGTAEAGTGAVHEPVVPALEYPPEGGSASAEQAALTGGAAASSSSAPGSGPEVPQHAETILERDALRAG
eukprot:4420882-Alexandrium_andersonii.AAC.1